jgi:hypothetical protein
VRPRLVWIARLTFVLVVIALLHEGLHVREEVGKNGFIFAGSDSYGYVGLANELITHHRYALAPPPAPLHWARPPGFPLYLVVVKGSAEAKMTGGDGWGKIARANVRLEVVGTGLLLCFGAGGGASA